MDLFKRGIRLFYVSNIMISLICTSFLGNAYDNTIENTESKGDAIVLDSEEPASQLGDGDKKEATILKETTSKKVEQKKTVSKVSKKEVASTVKYAPAKYSEVTGSAIVAYAKRYLGLRYVSGGNSLTKGTDCSGFTKLIYKEFGVTLSRTVTGQMKNGTYVRKADLQKGDLVIYGNGSGKPVHVAMYIGNGKVIHESNHRDGVKISNVNMMQYITSRRVINSNSIKIAEEQNKKEEEQKSDVVNNTDNTINDNVQDKVEENTNTNDNVENNANNIVEPVIEKEEPKEEEKQEEVRSSNEQVTSES